MRDGFRKRLNRLIKERGTTIAALARSCEIPMTTLHGWSTGTVPIDYEAVLCLAKELDVSFTYLLTGQEDSNGKNSVRFEDLIKSVEKVFEGYVEVSIKKLIPK